MSMTHTPSNNDDDGGDDRPPLHAGDNELNGNDPHLVPMMGPVLAYLL